MCKKVNHLGLKVSPLIKVYYGPLKEEEKRNTKQQHYHLIYTKNVRRRDLKIK